MSMRPCTRRVFGSCRMSTCRGAADLLVRRGLLKSQQKLGKHSLYSRRTVREWWFSWWPWYFWYFSQWWKWTQMLASALSWKHKREWSNCRCSCQLPVAIWGSTATEAQSPSLPYARMTLSTLLAPSSLVAYFHQVHPIFSQRSKFSCVQASSKQKEKWENTKHATSSCRTLLLTS